MFLSPLSYEYDPDSFVAVANIIRLIGYSVLWLVLGIVFGKKAQKEGLSFGLYFVITWLFGLIGMAVTLYQINKVKKEAYYRSQMGQQFYGNPYGAPQNPYGMPQNGQQPYGQQYYDPNVQNMQQPYGGTPVSPYQQAQPESKDVFTCPNCGNSQSSGGFCVVCGSKI